ncbi:MAG: VOC family protein [Pirellulales bacterium]
MPGTLPIQTINHLGRLTKRLQESRRFYCDVLGFREIRRPNFDFPGAWLFGYGFQIHLIQNDGAGDPAGEIQTRVEHLALWVSDMDRVELLLKEHAIPYRVSHVANTGVKQIFFRDPDGHHIEAANYPPTPEFI